MRTSTSVKPDALLFDLRPLPPSETQATPALCRLAPGNRWASPVVGAALAAKGRPTQIVTPLATMPFAAKEVVAKVSGIQLLYLFVIPAQAGIQGAVDTLHWIPACAAAGEPGMTRGAALRTVTLVKPSLATIPFAAKAAPTETAIRRLPEEGSKPAGRHIGDEYFIVALQPAANAPDGASSRHSCAALPRPPNLP